jgi:drug/metabolite transporter (DMT)-like permease
MLLVFGASVIGSLAAVLLKAGADLLHDPWWRWAPRLGGGIALFLVSSVLYVMGLREGSLTVLYPMVSLGYVWTLVWARLFFGEPFNRSKVAGLVLVLVGVFFIGVGNR